MNWQKQSKRSILSVVLLLILSVSCKKDNNVTTNPEVVIPQSVIVVNGWVDAIMKEVYLWEKNMPDINYTTEPDTKEYFKKLLYVDDKWSYITDNYNELNGALQGIYTSFGFSFSLYLKDEGESGVVAYVEYVLPNSPAENAGIKRGDIFDEIGGVKLSTTNYSDLLDQDFYDLGFVAESNMGYVEISKTAAMTAVEIEEDPIYVDTVYNVNGLSVGYLMYNAFINSDEDSAHLVNTFKMFQENNIDELVLDLRYNGGGSTYIATLLASMIAPSADVSSEKVFFGYRWNDLYMNYFTNEEGANSDNLVSRFMSDVPVNLNLNRLYVLTLHGTASASELIINGLNPYLDVVQIGDNTYGKYTVSIPIDDGHDQKIHAWGMLPIVAKSVNAIGVTDFKDGFTPDYEARDDYKYALGDTQEGMLKIALDNIGGNIYMPQKSASLRIQHPIQRLGGNTVFRNGVMTTSFR